MKILLVHNYYRSSLPSGENKVFDAEKDLLEQAGHSVRTFTKQSDDILAGGLRAKLWTGITAPFNLRVLAELRGVIARERPDVLHLHNYHPTISPTAVYATAGTATASVVNLPNYRVLCAAGLPLRNGEPCTLCLEKRSALPAMRHACYKKSRAATLPMAATIELHRLLRTWEKRVDAFVALSEFQRHLFGSSGLPEERIHVKPNFYPDSPASTPWKERETKAVCAGRLSAEKGVRSLVDAWIRWGSSAPRLEIIGSGPEEQELLQAVRGTNAAKRVVFLGQLSPRQTVRRIATARLAIIPSLWYEAFGLVITEAFAHGVPVACSRIGPLPERVEQGVTGDLFTPGDPDDLQRVVASLFADDLRLAEMSERVRLQFDEKYTAKVNLEQLVTIYDRAVSRRSPGRSR